MPPELKGTEDASEQKRLGLAEVLRHYFARSTSQPPEPAPGSRP